MNTDTRDELVNKIDRALADSNGVTQKSQHAITVIEKFMRNTLLMNSGAMLACLNDMRVLVKDLPVLDEMDEIIRCIDQTVHPDEYQRAMSFRRNLAAIWELFDDFVENHCEFLENDPTVDLLPAVAVAADGEAMP